MALAPALAIASLAFSAFGTGASFIGQIRAGQAAQAQANFQAQIARNNQIIAQRNADDARDRGKIAADLQRQKNAQLRAKQKTTLAANNVLIGQDAALQLEEDTAAIGELDALTIQSNAEREALGFEAQGAGFGAEASLQGLVGDNARSSSFLKAGSSLLSGTAAVADKWVAFKREEIL